MKQRNVIKLTLIRDKIDTYLKLWIAPEVEALFKEAALKEYGEAGYLETSSKWMDNDKHGLRFYKNPSEFKASDFLHGRNIAACNDFGRELIDGNGYVNIALLRVVGASVKSGVTLRTDELISYEELKRYVEMLAVWGKDFYRDYIKKSKLTAVIAYEM